MKIYSTTSPPFGHHGQTAENRSNLGALSSNGAPEILDALGLALFAFTSVCLVFTIITFLKGINGPFKNRIIYLWIALELCNLVQALSMVVYFCGTCYVSVYPESYTTVDRLLFHKSIGAAQQLFGWRSYLYTQSTISVYLLSLLIYPHGFLTQQNPLFLAAAPLILGFIVGLPTATPLVTLTMNADSATYDNEFYAFLSFFLCDVLSLCLTVIMYLCQACFVLKMLRSNLAPVRRTAKTVLVLVRINGLVWIDTVVTTTVFTVAVITGTQLRLSLVTAYWLNLTADPFIFVILSRTFRQSVTETWISEHSSMRKSNTRSRRVDRRNTAGAGDPSEKQETVNLLEISRKYSQKNGSMANWLHSVSVSKSKSIEPLTNQ